MANILLRRELFPHFLPIQNNPLYFALPFFFRSILSNEIFLSPKIISRISSLSLSIFIGTNSSNNFPLAPCKADSISATSFSSLIYFNGFLLLSQYCFCSKISFANGSKHFLSGNGGFGSSFWAYMEGRCLQVSPWFPGLH